MNTINPTEERVRIATSRKHNAEIDQMIEENLSYYGIESAPVIRARIDELDKEWDIERTLELNASIISFAGIVLAAAVNRKWLMLPAIVTAFLAQHAMQGWCPPVLLLRKMKVRYKKEIDKERYGLIEVLKSKNKDRYTK